MTHPVVSQIIELATPIAEQLNLELVNTIFQTNNNPPILRIDVNNPDGDTSLEDCERMSRALETELDLVEIIPGSYVLEVSSVGISRNLTTDREFISFKGFPAIVQTTEPYKKQQIWQGKLQGRDEKAVYLNQKGKMVAVPRNLVAQVQLQDSE